MVKIGKSINMAKNILDLESFKEKLKTDDSFIEEIIGEENVYGKDIIDIENGLMTIYAENINKYLEKYACKNVEELQDTLYYCYGIFCKVI